MSGRARAVLDRFPHHLSLSDPHKRFRRVAEGLTADLDVQSRQIGDVRRAHRLAQAPTTLDVSNLAALHGIAANRHELVERRRRALSDADPDDTGLVAVLTGIAVDDLDVLTTEQRLDLLASVDRFDRRLATMRGVVAHVIAAHRLGNGTATTLLMAATAYLGFEMDPAAVTHQEDRWWHTVPARDGLIADPAASTQSNGSTDPTGPTVGTDLFAVEENPFVEAGVTPVERVDGDRFRIRRGGLEDVVASVVVVGRQDRTVAPMVVNLDVGHGVVYDGVVGDGDELVFSTDGRVTVAGADMTGSGFMFTGGVFADRDQTHDNDFLFAAGDPTGDPATDPSGDRVAVWVTTTPVVDGFDRRPALPHGGTVGGLPLALGETRWAAFIRPANYGSAPPSIDPLAAVSRNLAGRFDRSVFAPGPVDDRPEPFGAIGFRWSEREPFAVRVHLPERLAAVDDEAGTVLREPLRALLDRHRAAGVHVSVAYGEPLWDLGTGIARDPESNEPLGTVVVGTTLWPDGTTQPTPM